MTTISRRAALAAPAAVALGAAPATSATHPDAEIIRLARLVVETETAFVASFQPPAETREEEERREPEQRRLSDLRCEYLDALTPLRAKTLPGLIAKARAAFLLANKQGGELVAHGIEDVLALGVVEDLVALGAQHGAA
jgi:hypothetical protein